MAALPNLEVLAKQPRQLLMSDQLTFWSEEPPAKVFQSTFAKDLDCAANHAHLSQSLRAPEWLVWETSPASCLPGFWTIGALGAMGMGSPTESLSFSTETCVRCRILGDWRRAAAVLFERTLQGHPAPSRKARQEIAGLQPRWKRWRRWTRH